MELISASVTKQNINQWPLGQRENNKQNHWGNRIKWLVIEFKWQSTWLHSNMQREPRHLIEIRRLGTCALDAPKWNASNGLYRMQHNSSLPPIVCKWWSIHIWLKPTINRWDAVWLIIGSMRKFNAKRKSSTKFRTWRFRTGCHTTDERTDRQTNWPHTEA